MLVSLKEVRKYVNLDGLSAADIANGLTFSGIEIEDVAKLASGTNLVIGEIKECVAHPDSDHLHVLKVDLGPKYGVEQIVCGAPNARTGLKVIVSRVGAKLPGGEIKAGVIRGVNSNGMCCSLLELGVNAKYLSEAQTKGIEELPSDAEVGNEDVLAYLGLDDEILDMKVLANRPDLLSIYNVAREIGAIFSREVNIPTSEVKENFVTNLKVNSVTPFCTQFSSREVKGIKVKASPKWMSEALRSMGIRSINNIVDIGNYVMLITGQPLHMYDADKLAKAELTAKSDYEGELVALDEKSYKIIKDDIVICCNDEPMCLGGVMGALKCAVDEKTTHVFIESASFEGKNIRHTSSRLGLVSESSQRFVKGTNHFQAKAVLDFAAQLLVELCEAKEVSNIVSFASEKEEENVISTTVNYINNRLGTEFSNDQVKEVLQRLNFKVDMNPYGTLVARIPNYRLDISCPADLSEEVIRLLGFSNVKSILPTLDVTVGGRTLEQQRLRTIREYLIDSGLDECLTYSLVSKKEFGKFNLLNAEEPYVLLNPLTDEHEVFRTHILHSLLSAASYNVNHQNKNLALFETASLISKASSEEHLSIVLVGKKSLQGQMSLLDYDFYDAKGLVEGIFEILGIEKSRYKFERATSHLDELHPGKSANVIFQNQVVGMIGELHPNQYKEYDLGKTHAVVVELKLGMILSAKVSITKMEAISKFPSLSRDLALLVDKTIPSSDLIKCIKVTGKGLVKDAVIFDNYEGEGIEANKKSVAISITFGSDERTLQDKEINDCLDQIKFQLTKMYNAGLRI